MKSLYLHIGLPKTGSTYLQQWLTLNRTVLAEAKVWVPAQPLLAHRVAAEFIADERRAARQDVKQIKTVSFGEARDQIGLAVADPRFASGILSSEYFCECPPREVTALREVTGAAVIYVVLFLRRQNRLLESGYNQEVKAMGATHVIGPPRYSPRADWLVLYESWAAAFGEKNLRFVNYDVVAARRELLPAFLKAVDLPAELAANTRTDIADSQNQSLPANLLEFKRLANALGDLGLEQWLYRAIGAGMSGPTFRLPPEIARQHLALYAESNRKLARRLGMTDGDDLFPAADLADVAPGRGADLTDHLPIETVAQLLALHVRQAADREAELQQQIERLETRLSALEARAAD
ncbi:MAG TPA: hypothetical protein VMI30_14030 [Stellaceae bacterium]|nr:hypothetical protein [Stellaceae bacterium]